MPPMEKQEMAKQQEISNCRTGLYAGLTASVLFGIMAVATRRSTSDIPATELLFIRSASSILAVVVLQPGSIRSVASGASTLGWLRSLFSAVAALFFVLNIQDSSPTTATLFQQLTPCLVMMLAWLLSIDELRKIHLMAAALATFGGLLIDPSSATVPNWVVTSRGLVGALAGAASLLTLRMASSKMTGLDVLLSLTVGQLFLSLCFFGRDWRFPPTNSLGSVAVVCVTYFLGNVLLAKSFRETTATVATTIALTSAIWTGILDHSVARQIPHASTVAAYGLILAAALLSGWPRGRD